MRSPTLMLLREFGPVTLDDWLSASFDSRICDLNHT